MIIKATASRPTPASKTFASTPMARVAATRLSRRAWAKASSRFRAASTPTRRCDRASGAASIREDRGLPRHPALASKRSVEHDVDVRDPNHGRWLRWGGSVGGFLDLTGHERILRLSVAVDSPIPSATNAIPFTELPTLGGDEPMHGFIAGRLVDRSAIASTLEYRWPIWAFLDASAQFAVGNVFGAHLDGFSPDLLRMDFLARRSLQRLPRSLVQRARRERRQRRSAMAPRSTAFASSSARRVAFETARLPARDRYSPRPIAEALAHLPKRR